MKRFLLVSMLGIFMTGLAFNQNPANGSELVSNDAYASSLPPSPDSSSPASVSSSEDEEDKLTIKKIMQLAHKSGLLKKVATGKATDEQLAELHRYYEAMPKLPPPKGEEESWQSKTEALAKASKAALDKEPDASALLKSATNCKACHDLHK